ncbi:hypothetical protein CKAH01_17643 [Colletotrichum kahawae]|uniref:Uncharacterized protein n=1 Tax=Colletotrichum kahawae TaxID=34407 RepID=A0AAE0D393_COLKA|nr:hypothetical protein CKAH01_17643 [Colletotrichum kahawae]
MRNDETSSLAQSWLVKHRYGLLRRDHSSSSSSPQQLNFDPPNLPHPQAQTQRERLKTITDEWVTQETSIVIKYPEYVNTVFGLTVILVVGGVLCGLLVGSRVDGVDPFNFTIFSWILGGFILLIAKIVRVSDWTWRDFLLRRVTCRSVCELANVTELSEQEILAHLLSSESHSILQTGGPLKAFAKYPVVDGLSIDVCPDLQTLVASGIVPVKVVTVDGEALVLLHLIPGRESVRDIPSSGSTDSMLVCTRLPQSSVDSEDLVFNWQELSWTKVLGVYNAVEKRVR